MDSYVIHIYRRMLGDPQAIVGTVEIAGVDGKQPFNNLRQMCEILLAPSVGYRVSRDRLPRPSAASVAKVPNPKEKEMKLKSLNQTFTPDFTSTLKAALLCTALVAAPFAQAEDAPPSYEAFPEVYKLVKENDQFRVIEATWKPGQKDAMHSHLPAVIYWITDCQLDVDIPGGKRIEGKQKAGASVINPAVKGHVAVNMGKDMCKALLVERK